MEVRRESEGGRIAYSFIWAPFANFDVRGKRYLRGEYMGPNSQNIWGVTTLRKWRKMEGSRKIYFLDKNKDHQGG